jgi:hypothetical protein
MKKIILYTLTILAFCNCQNKNEKTSLESQEIKDINEVVETVLIQDSLNVFSKSEDSKMICSELRKLHIIVPEKRKDGISFPPPPRDIYITSLLKKKIKDKYFFSSKDSLYFLNQHSDLENLKIGQNLINKLNVATIEEIEKKYKNDENVRFYEMTIPVFSSDRQKAYVQLDYTCGHLCGSGKAIYLKKIKGEWKIIQKRRTWVS